MRPTPLIGIRILAAACGLLALMCLCLALAWARKAEEAACFRQTLADGETPAIAETDCWPARR